MVQVTESGACQLQGSEANVIKGLVVKADYLVGILNETVEGEHCVVWLSDHVANLG